MHLKTNSLRNYLTLLLISASAFCQAETFYGPTNLENKSFEELTIHGPADLKRVRAKSLTVNGPLRFYEIEISGTSTLKGPTKGKKGSFQEITAHGPFKAEKIVISTLTVFGPVNLEDFSIQNVTKIKGSLKADKGVFQDLFAGSKSGGESISLEDVVVKNLTVNRGKTEEVLRLSGETTISGNVKFESDHGKIEKKGSRVAIEGEIQGVEKK